MNKRITLSEFKKGALLPKPIYRSKCYVIVSSEEVVVHTCETVQELMAVDSYYDRCFVDIRRHDIHLADNTKDELTVTELAVLCVLIERFDKGNFNEHALRLSDAVWREALNYTSAIDFYRKILETKKASSNGQV